MDMSTVEARSVAVVGMACRLPGASGPDELWDLLSGGVDATTATPRERYDVTALYPGKLAARRAGYVDGVADFDAEFFGMSAAEALECDPQQRLLLMTAWEALEDAGQRPDLLAGGRTGVFVGNSRSDYLENVFRQGPSAVTAAALNNVRSMLPARLSHFFDLRGPSVPPRRRPRPARPGAATVHTGPRHRPHTGLRIHTGRGAAGTTTRATAHAAAGRTDRPGAHVDLLRHGRRHRDHKRPVHPKATAAADHRGVAWARLLFEGRMTARSDTRG